MLFLLSKQDALVALCHRFGASLVRGVAQLLLPIGHVHDVKFPWVDTHHRPPCERLAMVGIESLEGWRGGSLFRNAVGAFLCAAAVLVHEQERYGHPIVLQHVIEVVPLLPKDTFVEVEQSITEQLLIIGHVIQQRTFSALIGEEVHELCRVDRKR